MKFSKDSTGDYSRTVTLNAGDEFKFTNQANWDGISITRNWGQITSQDSWVYYTTMNEEEGPGYGNFVIKRGGTYRFYWEADAIEGDWSEAEYGLHIQRVWNETTVYVDAYDWEALKLYEFETIEKVEEYADGAFPGRAVDFTDSNLTFNGGKLQAVNVKYLNKSNAQFIFSDGDSHQSGDMSITDGAYYYHDGENWVADTGDLAAAAKFVDDFNKARLAVAAAGEVKAYSICGLVYKDWLDAYGELSATAKGYVDAATIYTYANKESTGADTTYTFAQILKYMSDEYAAGRHGANLTERTINSKGISAIIIVVSSISVVSVLAAALIIKRRKEDR